MSAYDEDAQRLRRQIAADLGGASTREVVSAEYQAFRKQYLPRNLTIYEGLCRFAESLHIQPPAAETKRYQEAIETCHLDATPAGAYALSLLVPISILLLGIVVAGILPFIFTGTFSTFFFVVFAIAAVSSYLPIRNLPYVFAENWRSRASNQMVLCLFYITTYMRHTSNLERAVEFAAEHVGPPLSLDLKKVVWDVQTEKYSSLQESLDHYLLQWRETNLEFVEAINLVQSSLFETSQERRINALEKAMELMLEETYEKMLHYAQNLKSPMTMLHMLGIILPILGLVILPLAVSFLPEVKWYHLAVLYNVALPIGVYLLGKSILARRPNGAGDVDITDINPSLKKYQKHTISFGGAEVSISPAFEGFLIAGILLFVGVLPLLVHALAPSFDIALYGPFTVLGYVEDPTTFQIVGPYGLGAAILSLCLTLGVGLGLAHYYNVRSRRVIKIHDEAKVLEQEFAGAIFQLGNRLGDGIPAELAFSKVADVMNGTRSGDFFRAVAINIEKLGMSVEQAIFDEKRGAILQFPSPIAQSAMKVLIEASHKGPLEASQSLITMSRYIKEMHRVEERLKDLMADIISGMKSQINFLTPAIAGIVVGITSMITTILISLQGELANLTADGGDLAGSLGFGDFLGLGIPTYFFQFIVGLYVVQIIWLLAYLVNGIENGSDRLHAEYEQGRGLRVGTLLYVFIAFVVVIVFNIIAGTVLASV